MVYALGSNLYFLQKMMGICQSKIGDQHMEEDGGEGAREGKGVSWRGGLVISILQRLIVPWWPAVQFKVRGNIGDRGLSNTILEMSPIFIAILIHLQLVQILVHVVVSG